MSALEPPQGSLSPVLLRSQTPGASEKVLKYLESMSREGEEPDFTPPRSMVDPAEFRSTRSVLRSPPLSPRSLNNGAKSFRDEDVNGEDADSNIQEGRTSEVGEGGLAREPGPHDPPGPKYESYDSGPSFGNFGPLPADDLPASNNPFARNAWNPNWNMIHDPVNAFSTVGGQAENTPGLPTKVPLPPSELFKSPKTASVALGAEAARARSQLGGGVSSPRPSERPMSPKSATRTNSKGRDDDRPMSALSMKSKTTTRTRPTEKGTVYPPLPESRYGDGDTHYEPMSPISRARSKAPSISPSDSPSNYKPPKPPSNGIPRSPGFGSMLSGGRPFSPYRHGPTNEDLLQAAVRNRVLVIPEENEKESTVHSKPPSAAPSPIDKAPSQISKAPSQMSKAPSQLSKAPSQLSKAPSQMSKAPSQMSNAPSQTNGKAMSQISKVTSQPNGKAMSEVSGKQLSAAASQDTKGKAVDHAPSSDGFDPQEAQIVADALATQTPRTSYFGEQPLEADVTGHFHDPELCVLLHQEADDAQHEIVRKALRKAIRQRVKKLGMKYDAESIKQYRKSYHDHDPNVHLLQSQYNSDEPPKWASDLKREILLMQQRLESIGENLRPQDRSFNGGSRFAYEGEEYTRTPMTQTVNIQTQPTGTMADSMYRVPEDMDDNATETARPPPPDALSQFRDYAEFGQDNSPGSMVLEEELFKLRQKPASQSGRSHNTWEVTREDGAEFDEEDGDVPRSGLPTIPDTNGDAYLDHERSTSPPLPPLPSDGHSQDLAVAAHGETPLPPWQRVHQRLLNWAIVWPMSEFDQALHSTTRGNQVDEVALSIWATQTYKRYVRARLTENQQVDRLFVPPNAADAINNAVFNGRHGDACGMLKDLWSPFGLEGMPRLLIVLAKHRSDPNHWVVHRFSLPDGQLTTYDTYRERTLPDGRPLGWWFAIRIAWPNAAYPDPTHLVQKMVRLHRPMQLPIDNSVAAAGIWRNLLMGSRAERSLDLERLRDLINQEVKNLRQRKHLGKLSIATSKTSYEDML